MFAYLYQLGSVPYFTHGFSGSEYDMIYEWYTTHDTDYDEQESIVIMQAFKLMKYHGKKLFKSIIHKYHLQQFESRVRQFKPTSKMEITIHEASRQLLTLYKQYPKGHFSFCRRYEKLFFMQSGLNKLPHNHNNSVCNSPVCFA